MIFENRDFRLQSGNVDTYADVYSYISTLHSCQHGLDKMRDVFLIVLAL